MEYTTFEKYTKEEVETLKELVQGEIRISQFQLDTQEIDDEVTVIRLNKFKTLLNKLYKFEPEEIDFVDLFDISDLEWV